MRLKHKKETVFFVDYKDFDNFVSEVYNCDYEFVAEHEANNYSSYEFEAPNLNEDYDDEYAKIRAGKLMSDTHGLFNCLYEDGHIEKGKYVINVYW